ncbi:MAG: hypothetical protein L0Y74_05155 [candidate division Zixibacteria bacterium]|nr:hypothetical protein [candidate division Zixibacteria bacterium]
MSGDKITHLSDKTDPFLTRYKRVSALYKTILDLASKILYEVESGGSEKLISALMKEKLKVAEKIREETEFLSDQPVPTGEVVNSSMVQEAKDIISDIKIMLSELYEREERIVKMIKKSKLNLE